MKTKKIKRAHLKRMLFNEAWKRWEKTGENLGDIVDGLALKYRRYRPSEDDLATIYERLETMRVIFERPF